jgi:uncharacterized protein YggE
MAEIVITVRGSHEDRIAPERATVALVADHQGAEKARVYSETTTSASRVTDLLRPLADAGAVTRWASDEVRTWSERPWNQEGRQLPLVFHASVGVEAEFGDFATLSTFLDQATGVPGVSVNGVTWSLPGGRRREVEREARRRAVLDATERATDYATAIGLTTVRASAIADVGMLGDDSGQQGPGGGGGRAYARMAALDTGPAEGAIDLTPRDVIVAAAVDARFAAS